MKTRMRGFGKTIAAIASLSVALPVVGHNILGTRALHAQVVPADAQFELCKRLLTKEVRQLTDDEVRILRACLEPLKQRGEEKKRPAAEIPPIQQMAPPRIYGK